MLVRGFAGFGSGMIIMAAASSVLSPFAALAFLVVATVGEHGDLDHGGNRYGGKLGIR